MLTNGGIFLRMTYLRACLTRTAGAMLFPSQFARERFGFRCDSLGEDEISLFQRVFRLLDEELDVVVRLLALVAQGAVVDGVQHGVGAVDRRADVLRGAARVRGLRRTELRYRRHRRRGWFGRRVARLRL